MRKLIKKIFVLIIAGIVMFNSVSIVEAAEEEKIENIPSEKPVLSQESEAKIRKDYLRALKESNPDESWIQDMEESDIIIRAYYGTYHDCEVVVMGYKDMLDMPASEKIEIGGYAFWFANVTEAYGFYLHKENVFIPMPDAYEEGSLTDEDLTAISEIFGKNSYKIKCDYQDVSENDWFYGDVAYVDGKGIMTGLKDKIFGPDKMLARAQFMVLLHRMEGEPEATLVSVGHWPDVTEDWYKNAVYWGFQNKIMRGYSNSDYWGTNDNMTREQLATVLYRYAEYKEYNTMRRSELDRFEDAVSVSEFARNAVQWAVAEGIITGKDDGKRLDPQGDTTRAECAAMIRRFMER